jgi:hypothetical protein
MKLPPNTPLFEFTSDQLGVIKVRRISAHIYDSFKELDSLDPKELVKCLVAQVGYWPDSLNVKGEFQDEGRGARKTPP